MKDLESLSDKELYQLCQTYGANIRMLVKKFAALLPEVEKRQLYKKYGFHSIFEFAGRIAGMRRETVLEVLRVAERLHDKPLLLAQMEEQGWSKLRIVAPLASPENEKMLAEKVKEMSKPTLEMFVREMKKQNEETVQFLPGEESRFRTDFEESSNRQGQSSRIFLRLLLEPNVDLRFREVQKKISKETGAPVDFNETLKTLLDYYENGHGKNNKTGIAESQKVANRPAIFSDMEKETKEKAETVTGSRYIPARIKKFLHEKYKGRCAYPGCMKLPEILHHTRRFALNPSHDPDFVVPLCKEHERLAHQGLIENEEKPPEEWRLKMEREKAGAKYAVDKKVNTLRMRTCYNSTDSV